MALDRLVAEVMLLVGSLYLGYSLFIVLGHMGLAMMFMNNVEKLSVTSISVPDAVIVSNGTDGKLYLVIYNNGYTPIYVERVILWHGGNETIIPMNNTYLNPGSYVVIDHTVPYTQCRIDVIFCISNTTLCMVYDLNATDFAIP